MKRNLYKINSDQNIKQTTITNNVILDECIIQNQVNINTNSFNEIHNLFEQISKKKEDLMNQVKEKEMILNALNFPPNFENPIHNPLIEETKGHSFSYTPTESPKTPEVSQFISVEMNLKNLYSDKEKSIRKVLEEFKTSKNSYFSFEKLQIRIEDLKLVSSHVLKSKSLTHLNLDCKK